MCDLCAATWRKKDLKVVAGFSCSEVANSGDTGSSVASNSMSHYSADQIAYQLTNGYWGGNARAFDVGVGGTISVDVTALASAGQSLAQRALELWSDATGLNFAYTSGGAQITFDDTETYSAYSYSYRSSSNLTSSFVNVGTGWVDYYSSNTNSYSLQTYIHEIGHALGLGHAGDYNGSATYGTSNHYVNDSWQASVMSYFSQSENTAIPASYAFALTPQVADIIAIRNLYGTAGTTRTGDTTYGDNANSGDLMQQISSLDQRISFTIIDDGGIDTIDFSSEWANQLIDLNEEAISNVRGYMGNLQIARNTVIENAIGGNGDDTLTGNAVANRLSGGAGRDTLLGEDGNDILTGGTGADSIDGGSGYDWAFYADSNARVVINLDDGNAETGGHANQDVLTSIEAIYGSAFNDAIVGNGANNFLLGGLGNDKLTGGAGADTLRGEEGNDVLSGGIGADKLDGGTGYDWVLYSGSNNRVIVNLGDTAIELGGFANGDLLTNVEAVLGSSFGDTITGSGANNGIFGGAGNDKIFGASGRDYIRGDAGSDVIDGGTGADTIDGGAGHDWAFYNASGSGVEIDLADGLTERGGDAEGDLLISIEAVVGSAHDDTIIGNSANNFFNGGSGNDTMSGGSGRDTLRGDAGNDVLTGGSGADTFHFRTLGGDDTITDFEDGIDAIRFDSAIASFSDLTISDKGGETLVSFSGSSITLQGFDHTLLAIDDFAFV